MSDELETITESAKAVQEVAKLGAKVIDAAQTAAPFINRVLGSPLEDATGLLISDPLRAARILAQDWYRRRVTEILRARDIRDEELKAVPPSIAVPLLEAAQDEARDELREFWARLLANAMDPGRSSRVRLEFIETLKQLTPQDALMLNEVATSPALRVDRGFLTTGLRATHEEIDVSAQHLQKLGCLDLKTDKDLGLTSYGKLFLRACEGP